MMGNLRQKYTEKEWQQLKENGMSKNYTIMEDDGNCCCECGLNLDNAEHKLCEFRGEEIKRLNKKLTGVNHLLSESIKMLQSAYLHSE